MDYRHTEHFARTMEAAALRAQGLRREAATQAWDRAGRVAAAVLRALFGKA